MPQTREPIAVIGTGYVGLVTAAGFAELGNEVWCVDVDRAKVQALERGEIPIYEPGLADCVAANRARMHFSTELGSALEHVRLLLVAVGTPPTYSGDADLSAVHAVVDALPNAGARALVMKSTVPVGTGVAIRRALDASGRAEFAYVSCPEFLKEGSALHDFRHPDRVVIGDGGSWAGDAVAELYAPLDAPLIRTDIASAEMIKLAANAFLATKISFINEIANVCEETGADVLEVAKGMGLDTRIGNHFLKAGIGYGGSCLLGDETVLARRGGRTSLLSLARLWAELAREHDPSAACEPGQSAELIEPTALEVLSWPQGEREPVFLPVLCATRRAYEGAVIEVRTKMGRRLTTTADHPWVTGDGSGSVPTCKPAQKLTTSDWVPLALGGAAAAQPAYAGGAAAQTASLLRAVEVAQISPSSLIVHAPAAQIERVCARPIAARRAIFSRSKSAATRTGEVRRTGSLRMDEARRADLKLAGTRVGTTENGTHARSLISLDGRFWRVLGLYLAGGCTVSDGARRRIQWSFHPRREEHLVTEVVEYWAAQSVVAKTRRAGTAHRVEVSSRLLAAWWTGVLGLGSTSYQQRLPDLIWERPADDRWALLSGLFEGDGSWSLIDGGPSVLIELGTVSDELADGVMRLLASVGAVASRRIGRVAKSTKDTHWIRISGARQVEHAIELVPQRDRAGVLASLTRLKRRIAPAGYRRLGDGAAWVRVTDVARRQFRGPVYSLEVPYTQTFITTGGLAIHNCFPKDVSALKQLAGNSGYHFQLLTAVIEVNELQKRRVIAKLQKHLGTLVGRTVALLGLAFKAQTDDMREASSLVLAARLQAAGAHVHAYDPVALDGARALMAGVQFCGSAREALAGADAAVLVTEWPEFAELDWPALAGSMRGRVLIDGRNFLSGEVARAAGLEYEGIGR